MAADSAGRLKELADSAGLPLGAFIEKLLDCYQSDSTVIAGSDDLHSTVADLNSRVLVLESRLQALEAVGAVTTGAVGKETVSAACEPVDVAVKIEPAANSTINQSTDDWESAVIKHYNNGVRGWETIAKMTYAAGYQTKNGTMRDGSHVSKVIKATGLKD